MNKMNSKQFKEILNYIENNYEENSIIYTDQISMKFGISTMLAYKYLEKVAEANYISQTTEIVCPHCGKKTGKFFNSIFSIPDTLTCPNCNATISDPLRNTIAVYKKLNIKVTNNSIKTKYKPVSQTFEILSKNMENAELKTSIIISDISARIANERIKRNMSQEEFAKFMETSKQTVTKWESGGYNFNMVTLCKICQKLNWDIDLTITEK